MNGRNKSRGFTLIELIIAVTIVIILAALAIPNYRGHVQRSNRGDAMAALLRIAAAQEKFYLQNNRYSNDLGPDGLNVGETDGDDYLSANKHYRLTVPTANADAFIAIATPFSAGQAADTQCTQFRLDQRGNKVATGSGEDPTAVCWR